MRFIDAATIDATLDVASLVEALRATFVEGCEMPLRHRHALARSGEADAQLLLMPAWRAGGPLGVKLVTVVPGNAARGLASVAAVYVLFDAATGAPRALLDGHALTLHRTAAASALAAGYLARRDAARLLVVGTGALAPRLARAHGAVRPIAEVTVWGRNPDKARRLAETLDRPGRPARATGDLEAAVRRADIVSCATLATEPLVLGDWLKPGAHLDLVGGFTPAMREADDRAVARARLYVDGRDAALKEAGDLVQPIERGVVAAEDVGDLFDLARGVRPGRRDDDEITLFKSVGLALEDLAAATLVAERLSVDGGP